MLLPALVHASRSVSRFCIVACCGICIEAALTTLEYHRYSSHTAELLRL